LEDHSELPPNPAKPMPTGRAAKTRISTGFAGLS
jgi:hypothetical protein